ncbi:DUF3784 domain-containing protein [Sutcliffiella deserti]|uniref:DUF3784 domain-containing protein n=1 Tax=Sutcliffiella deserti TaxID=2875501 RepID=UPI001CBAB520|nr:DUF3784 domain-containing protein [Sutcliffiella deserti]
MWAIVSIQFFLISLFLILGWVIYKKKAYGLVSGFQSRSETEQQEMIDNGYPQNAAKLLLATAVGMLTLLPLQLLEFTYALEIQFGFMLLFLLGGFVYLSKFEVPKRRKISYIISSSIFVLVLSFVSILTFLGYQEFKLVLNENSLEVTGIYGDDWSYEDIEQVDLLEEMPEVTLKQNGFGMASMSKGYFKVENYGSSLLFLYKDFPPYLYIKMENEHIFLNAKSDVITEKWYIELQKRTSSNN